MAEDERIDDDADAGLGSRSGARIEGEAGDEGGGAEASGAELSGAGDPASVDEGGESRGAGDEGGRGGRAGDWNPGQASGGGGEVY